MSTQWQRVETFNRKVLGILPREHGLQDLKEAELSYTQLIEEAKEFLDARHALDYIGSIDAIIDSMVFSLGVLYKLGVTEKEFNQIFDTVMDSNMRKKVGVKQGREGFNALDAVRDEGFIPPEESISIILGSER